MGLIVLMSVCVCVSLCERLCVGPIVCMSVSVCVCVCACLCVIMYGSDCVYVFVYVCVQVRPVWPRL